VIGSLMSEPERQDDARRKSELRARLRAARAARPAKTRQEAGAAIAAVDTARPELRHGGTVAAYASVLGEPDTRPLLDALAAHGGRILLPVLCHDGQLDWAEYDGALTAGPYCLREPGGPRLGIGGLAGADLALVPALAVARDGTRLGRGGGAYDRALARAGALLAWAVVYDDEVFDTLPSERHDRPVAAAVTPSGWKKLRARDG
jgi:5-formyltetrahydrofolate cyclo-ligase